MAINYANERKKMMYKRIAKLKMQQCIVKPERWDKIYMQLKGIKGFWDELTWDQILEEFPELFWVKEVREDETFRAFYKIKTDLEQLESLEVK